MLCRILIQRIRTKFDLQVSELIAISACRLLFCLHQIVQLVTQLINMVDIHKL